MAEIELPIQVEEIGESSSMGEQRHEQQQRQHQTIFRVPNGNSGSATYEPSFVSIGPYYFNNLKYYTMQEKKHQCLQDLGLKIGGQFALLEEIKAAFEPLEGRARDCYGGSIRLGRDAFLEMLALDCCFVIRLVMLISQNMRAGRELLGVNITELRPDLLLLENQIPLFLLRTAYECVCLNIRANEGATQSTLKDLPPFLQILEPFICLDMPWRFNANGMSDEADHLLDLYWRCCLPPDHELELSQRFISVSEDKSTEQRIWAEFHLPANMTKLIPNTLVLNKTAGVRFLKRDYDEGFKLSFEGGTIKMPCLKIDSSQTKILLNLIFFENFMHVPYRVITSYMLFMDALIDTEKDVEILQEQEVISNTLFSNTFAAGVFNGMGNYCSVNYKDNYFYPLCQNIQEYYKSKWNRRFASLRNNYFSSPWAGISVVAASFLLVMSFVQTFYTVFGYYRSKN